MTTLQAAINRIIETAKTAPLISEKALLSECQAFVDQNATLPVRAEEIEATLLRAIEISQIWFYRVTRSNNRIPNLILEIMTLEAELRRLHEKCQQQAASAERQRQRIGGSIKHKIASLEDAIARLKIEVAGSDNARVIERKRSILTAHQNELRRLTENAIAERDRFMKDYTYEQLKGNRKRN